MAQPIFATDNELPAGRRHKRGKRAENMKARENRQEISACKRSPRELWAPAMTALTAAMIGKLLRLDVMRRATSLMERIVQTVRSCRPVVLHPVGADGYVPAQMVADRNLGSGGHRTCRAVESWGGTPEAAARIGAAADRRTVGNGGRGSRGLYLLFPPTTLAAAAACPKPPGGLPCPCEARCSTSAAWRRGFLPRSRRDNPQVGHTPVIHE